MPSVQDILNASEKGIKETYFETDQRSIRVLQLCGQGCEQRKWIHLFEKITSIMFYASLSDYDEPASWSEQVWLSPMLTMHVTKRLQTRLAESLHLFESVVNSRWFMRTSIILFLTDMAEFGTKIHEVYWKLAYLLACIQESLISSGASGSILSGIYGRYIRQ